MPRVPDATADRSRRRFLTRGLAAGAGGLAAAALPGQGAVQAAPAPVAASDVEPFWGPHQGGIATPQQGHTYFAAFDVQADQRAQVEQLLRDWTLAAARLTQGQPTAATRSTCRRRG